MISISWLALETAPIGYLALYSQWTPASCWKSSHLASPINTRAITIVITNATKPQPSHQQKNLMMLQMIMHMYNTYRAITPEDLDTKKSGTRSLINTTYSLKYIFEKSRNIHKDPTSLKSMLPPRYLVRPMIWNNRVGCNTFLYDHIQFK